MSDEIEFEDVEGHVVRLMAEDAGETDGHRLQRQVEDAGETEGHRSSKKASRLTMGEADEDEVSGHRMI